MTYASISSCYLVGPGLVRTKEWRDMDKDKRPKALAKAFKLMFKTVYGAEIKTSDNLMKVLAGGLAGDPEERWTAEQMLEGIEDLDEDDFKIEKSGWSGTLKLPDAIQP
jgi:hypothetical protein